MTGMRMLLFVLPMFCLLLACGCTEAKEKQPVAETPPPEEVTKPSQEEETPKGEGETAKTEETAEPKEPEEVEVGVLETGFGKMVIEFYPDLAPKTVKRIKELIGKGFYDGLIFHRVVPGFCIQGGDPTGTGMGGTDETIPGEFTKTPFVDGSVGMARSQGKPDSNDCQFFITLGRADNLDNNYTLFGKVIEGLEVAHKIEKVETFQSRPTEKVKIISFRLEKRKTGK